MMVELNTSQKGPGRMIGNEVQQKTGPEAGKKPHPGYAKITAWVKRTCGDRIAAISDPAQRTLELERITTKACTGLSEKTRKGFFAYLRSQNYEQLLK